MHLPDDLRYSTDHEWVRLENGQLRLGITDYAQDALGDVVYVEAVTGDDAEPGSYGLRQIPEVNGAIVASSNPLIQVLLMPFSTSTAIGG